MNKTIKVLERDLAELEAELVKSPKGKLVYSRCGKYINWYQYIEGKKQYISVKNRNLAMELGYKKIRLLLLEKLRMELKAQKDYMESCAHQYRKEEELLEKVPELRELVGSYLKSCNKKYQEWMNEPYTINPKHPERLLFTTKNGIKVRSKSEVLIVHALLDKEIPFRYECGLRLGNYTIYPDFTIRHPLTGEIYYWEHFGMMDDDDYVQKACVKIKMYAVHGIMPSDKLLMTFEGKNHPLNLELIEDMLRFYFG